MRDRRVVFKFFMAENCRVRAWAAALFATGSAGLGLEVFLWETILLKGFLTKD